MKVRSPEFLNVDLELRTRSSTNLISIDFGKLATIISDTSSAEVTEVHLTTYELNDSTLSTPDEIISSFCNLIDKLPLKSRKQWKMCMSRRFDIGFASGKGNQIATAILSPFTLKRCSELGCEIAVTVYPNKL